MIARRVITDWSLTVVAIMALLDAMVIPPLAEIGLINKSIADATFISVLAVGAWLLFDRTPIGKVFVALATVSVVLRVSHVLLPEHHYPLGDAWLSALSLLALSWLMIIYTLAPGHINVHRIAGGVGAYVLIGLAFSQLHQIVSLNWEGAYLMLGTAVNFEQMQWHFNYFSFVVLTTLGFGDIAPAHPVAKALCNFESLIGVLYPVVFLGWVVSHTPPEQERDDAL